MKHLCLIFIFCISGLFLLSSCGTVQPSVPPFPLNKGTTETRIGVGMSLSEYNVYNLQLSVYYAVSDKDMIGFIYNNLNLLAIIPGHFVYAHYWLASNPNFGGNFQFHVGGILNLEKNPSFEADAALTNHFSDKAAQSIKAGVSYCTPPVFQDTELGTFVPVLGYSFQYDRFQAEAQLFWGYTKYLTRYFNNKIKRRYGHDTSTKIIIPGKSILSINDTVIMNSPEWNIELKDSSKIILSHFPPYPDCIFCWEEELNKSKYRTDTSYKILWVYKTGGSRYNATRVNLLELNVQKILSDYRNGSDLIIGEDEDLLKRKLGRIKEPWDDINFGMNYVFRKD